MTLFYSLFIVCLVIYEAVYGTFDYQKFKRKVQHDPRARVRYYKKVMLSLWIQAFLILGVTAIGPNSLHDIGLKGISINTSTLGPWVTYIAFGLAGMYLISLIYYLIGYKVSKKIRNEIVNVKKSEFEKSSFKDILPKSKEDKKVWTYVSWTAGLTEELIYRGFLLFALTQLFPNLSIWAILVLASVFFGLAHTYQGYLNVIKTSVFGVIFAILYIGLGSIYPLIIVHFLIDYVGKIGDEK